jgi:peptidoglycan/LPS O-acetylase OafA/YrhL
MEVSTIKRRGAPADSAAAKPDGKLKHSAYRPDIDGLRAIAVIAVIAFHAFPRIVPGGFIGVDIFFVISGFLISGIIFSNVESGTFSYIEFYKRRIKRIFPALIIVLVTVLTIGWIVLFSSEYRELGVQTLAATGFLSNFILWHEAGYFATSSDYKQLLHLWSLGVEEQFYIFWPLLVGFVWRRWNLLSLTVVMGVASFFLNLYLTHAYPDAAYYLPFSRFWELMIGGCLAYTRLRNPQKEAVYPNLQSWLGLALILSGFVFITSSSPFPGWRALFPALGTFFMISAGEKALPNRFFLSNRLMVGIGLISYPLYLWHWPLLSYLLMMKGGVESTTGILVAVALAFLLAYATYALIEKPIRRMRRGDGHLALALLGTLVVVGLSGLVIRQAHGFRGRAINRLNISDNMVGHVTRNVVGQCGLTRSERHGIGACLSDSRQPPVYAMVGDSKALALFPGVFDASRPNGRWLLMAGVGPAAVPAVKADAPALAANPNIRVVVLTFAIRSLFVTHDRYLADLPQTPNYNLAFQNLDSVIGKLAQSRKKVVIVADNPTLADSQLCMTRQTQFHWLNALFAHPANSECSASIASIRQRTAIYHNLLTAEAAKWPGTVTLYDPTQYLCDELTGICPEEMDGHMLYSYGDHISRFAGARVGSALVPAIGKIDTSTQ